MMNVILELVSFHRFKYSKDQNILENIRNKSSMLGIENHHLQIVRQIVSFVNVKIL